MDIENIKIIRERRASIVLKILRDGSIVVKAPYLVPERIVRDFIKKNSEVINKNRKKIMRSVSAKKKYVNGERFLYLGDEYELQIGRFTTLKVHQNKLLFPQVLLFRVEKEIENWYLREAKQTINALLVEYAREMRTSFVSVHFSDTRSKWGSCTHDNRLQFNWRLIMAPILVVRYVIIHELAHTLEKNHSRLFWNRVRAFNPSYREQIKWLKTHGNALVA